MLERTGEFEVVGHSSDGLGVIPQVIASRPNVVLIDVGMPGQNGLEACRALALKLPALPILMFSMHSDPDFIIRALEYGARGYLLKDSGANDLLEALKTVTTGTVYLDPRIDKRLMLRLRMPKVDAYESLTPRQRQILQLVSEGLTNRKIAETLGIAPKTVDTHRMRLMKALDIHDVTTLVKFYLKHNGGLSV